MKRTLLVIFIFLSVYTGLNAQSIQKNPKKGNQGTETKSLQKQTTASLHGVIMDTGKGRLSGASVLIVGTKKLVNANETGEYFFDHLQEGKISVQASIMGFKTQTVDIVVKPGQNDLDFSLGEENIRLDPITVVAQKREQQILEVLAVISVVGYDFIEM